GVPGRARLAASGADASPGERPGRRRRHLPGRVHRERRARERGCRGVEARRSRGDAGLRPRGTGSPRLPVLAADLRSAGGSGPACAGVPSDARAARAVGPHRRLAALRRAGSRRDRVLVREGRTRDPRLTVRVGVVGGGLIAQAEHLPYLSSLRDRFSIAALAEPSLTVREALAARYGIGGVHADYRSMLDAGGLDAVVVSSPHGTHAEVVLAALAAGLHVFVEKPMCITLADADAIVAERDRARKVVQVGTMKRYDPAVETMLDALPGSAEHLRYVSVVVNDPEFEPFFEPGEIVRGNDVPRELVDETRRQESE